MKDLTWEYVVENCEKHIQHFKGTITQQTGSNTEWLTSFLKSTNGLKAAVPGLRANSELEKIPPMMSLLGLRWLLGSNLEVDLFYASDKEKYEVKIVRWADLVVLKQADVSLDEVADTVWEFIEKVRNKEN